MRMINDFHNIGRGRRNRTHLRCFGDSSLAFRRYPCILVNHLGHDPNFPILAKNHSLHETAGTPVRLNYYKWRKIEESNPGPTNDPSVFETALIPYQSIFLAEYTGFEPVEDLRHLCLANRCDRPLYQYSVLSVLYPVIDKFIGQRLQ